MNLAEELMNRELSERRSESGVMSVPKRNNEGIRAAKGNLYSLILPEQQACDSGTKVQPDSHKMQTVMFTSKPQFAHPVFLLALPAKSR